VGGKKIVSEERSYSWTQNGDMGHYGSFDTALKFSGEVIGIANITSTSFNSLNPKYGTSRFPAKIDGNVVHVGWTAYGTMVSGTITVTAIVSK
jgi:hypothetical protein